MMVTGLVGQRCSAVSESERCSSACWRTRAPGTAAALVLHGEPGVGKTALLDLAVELGDDFRVVRTAGVEGEMELPVRRAPAARARRSSS